MKPEKTEAEIREYRANVKNSNTTGTKPAEQESDTPGAQAPELAADYLMQAVGTVKARESVYDTEEGQRSMQKTVTMFNALTGHTLTEEQGWKFMMCLKLVRSEHGEFKADDLVDAAGYSGLANEAQAKAVQN